MTMSDDISSSPPGPSTSSVDAIAYYKAQYESLEAELADFQSSSKELEAELEKDIEAAEKRERQLKEKADNLTYEVDEWKTKYKQSKTEAGSVQNTLQKEITTLRDANRTLQMRLRDIEVANDDFERQQRNTESSLEDMESRYSMAIERSVMMEEEVKVGEQEREALRIDAQRLRDELSDLRIEAEIIKEKLKKAEENVDHRRNLSQLKPIPPSASPRSEVSPTTTDSTPSFDTPPGKTVSSSGLSDAPTPPSPSISEQSTNATKPFKTPSIPKTRLSITSNNTTPRPSTYSLKPTSHSRRPSVPVASGRSTPSTNLRSSISRPSTVPQRQAGLPQSNSIYHLHNLQGKMQRLTERVHTAKSRLPAPVNTPPKSSPRNGPSTLSTNIPATVTMRSARKRANGSTISGQASLPDQTPTPTQRSGLHTDRTTPSLQPKSSRQSLTMPPPTATPTRGAPPSTTETPHPSHPRPNSRASTATAASTISSRASALPTHKQTATQSHARNSLSISTSTIPLSSLRHPAPRPGSALGLRPSSRTSQHRAPNASTDRVRPKSGLSQFGADGAADMDMEDEVHQDGEGDAAEMPTPTPRRTTMTTTRKAATARVSDVSVSSALGKRSSISRLPAPVSVATGRMSFGRPGSAMAGAWGKENEDVRPSSSKSNRSFAGMSLRDVGEDGGVGEVDETF